jgi:hypothetical protein
VPINQAPRRNFMLCREIRQQIGLFRLVRRPAELLGFDDFMANFEVPISQAPSGSREVVRRCGETAFFGGDWCVRAASAPQRRGVSGNSAGTPEPAPLYWVSVPLGSGTASSSHRSCLISRDTNAQFARPNLGIVFVAGRASGKASGGPGFAGSGAGDGSFGAPSGRDAGGDMDGGPVSWL